MIRARWNREVLARFRRVWVRRLAGSAGVGYECGYDFDDDRPAGLWYGPRAGLPLMKDWG